MVPVFFGSAGPAVRPARREMSRGSIPPVFDANTDVQQLSRSQWRVCDTRWPEHDARNLLGFIEKKGELFEVVRIDHGLERFSFVSLAEATSYFSPQTCS